ncbi:acyl-CoA dehydrogenase family protein [Streptomyces sp. NPDC054887]
MGIGFTREHHDLAVSYAAGSRGPCRARPLHKVLDGAREGRPAYWDEAAELGLHGIHLPEEYGAGGTPLDLVASVRWRRRPHQSCLPVADITARLLLRHRRNHDLG